MTFYHPILHSQKPVNNRLVVTFLTGQQPPVKYPPPWGEVGILTVTGLPPTPGQQLILTK